MQAKIEIDLAETLNFQIHCNLFSFIKTMIR